MKTISLWTVTFVIFLVIHYDCEAAATYNQNEKNYPQKMVEIIELMLSQPQGPKKDQNSDMGVQKVPQEESPGYKILITPNKNPEPAGTQKIKIFVEAKDYDEKNRDMIPQETRTYAFVQPKSDKQNIFEVLPLSIETAGVNIDDYQKTNIQNGKARINVDELLQKDSEWNPSKRQTNSGTTQKPKQTVKTTSRNTQSTAAAATTTRRETTKHPTTRITTKQTYEPKTSTESMYSTNAKPNSYGLGRTVVLTVNEELPLSTSQIEPSYVDQNRPYQQKSEDRRSSSYESDYAKTNPKIQNPTDSFGYIQPAEETYSRSSVVSPIEYRPSNTRRPVESSYDDRPTYSTDREPERQKESRPYYESRDPDDEDIAGTRPSRQNRPYNEEEQERPYSNDNRQPSYTYTTQRPVKEDEYGGFPESFQPVDRPDSRPLQYEPARAFPASPCIQVFKYQGREPEEDRWYADIFVSTDETLIGMRIDIKLDRPADLLTNWISDVKTKDNVHFTILSLKKKLVPGPAENVRIMVKFDRNKPVPYLQSINLNGRRICPSRSNNHGSQSQRTTTRRTLYENPADLQTKRTTEYYPQTPTRPSPSFVDEYEQGTRRPASQEGKRPAQNNNDRRPTEVVYEENTRTTPRTTTEYYNRPNPNPNGYEDSDLNDFNRPATKKPTQSRPTNSRPTSNTQTRPSTSSSSSSSSSSSNSNNNNNNNNSNRERPKQIPCGKPSVQPRPLITSGQMTSRGQWPWHVALYKNVGADLSYICGGSLISNQHIVTAAHCVTKTYDTIPLDANSLVVYLGKYHLKLWSEGGVQNKQVKEVHVHPNYNSTDFRADLAVLTLSSPVEFTEYIRPVCLWDKRSTKIEDIEGKEGTVVGWGFDETKRLTEELMQAKMPVIKHDVCLWSYPQFFPQFTSNLTYCAGFKNGTSVCNGDSGGGMFFPTNEDQEDQRWYIRGLVSISVKQKDTILCDVKHYIVFTDLAKFSTWLNDFSEND